VALAVLKWLIKTPAESWRNSLEVQSEPVSRPEEAIAAGTRCRSKFETGKTSACSGRREGVSHAKIGQLTLENYSVRARSARRNTALRKAMIDQQAHALPVSRQSSWWHLLVFERLLPTAPGKRRLI